MDNKELRDLIYLILIAVPVFALILLVWPYTPMYNEIKEKQKINAIHYVQYWWMYGPNDPERLEKIKGDFGITPDNPQGDNFSSIFDSFIDNTTKKAIPFEITP